MLKIFLMNIITVIILSASMTCFVSLLCGIILGWMDYRAEKILNRQEESMNEEPFHLKDIMHFRSEFWLISVIAVVYYLALFPFIALGKWVFVFLSHIINLSMNKCVPRFTTRECGAKVHNNNMKINKRILVKIYSKNIFAFVDTILTVTILRP